MPRESAVNAFTMTRLRSSSRKPDLDGSRMTETGTAARLLFLQNDALPLNPLEHLPVDWRTVVVPVLR